LIPELEARQAIMLACDAGLTAGYYPAGYGSEVTRGISKASWVYNLAYPDGAPRAWGDEEYAYIPNNKK